MVDSERSTAADNADHRAADGHSDENSAPNQEDSTAPRPASQEKPMTTPDVSKRTPDAQFPMGDDVPEIGDRDKTAAGFTAIYETFRFIGGAPLRGMHALVVMNKKGGFDCPSCAWPDPDGLRKPAEFCENGAKAAAWETTNKRVGPEFFAGHSVAELAAKPEQWLGDQGRITQPMVLRRGSQFYQAIDWPDAFQMIADAFDALASPDEALFYTSGRASNEAAFLYQLFARQFGTNNLPDCSNMCHESSGLGLTKSIGIGKGTVKLSDFDRADAIFIIGQNPGTCHPRMLTELGHAAKNGCKIVSVNPLLETGMIRFKNPQTPFGLLGRGQDIACLHLPVRIAGDMALLKGIMKEMLDINRESGGKVFDKEFIREHTTGFEEFVADLNHTEWDEILHESGVQRELIRQAAEIAAKSERMITCWAMGVTQHKNAVGTIQTIVNFHLLRGQIGRVGAGVCPVRGHSNVQGDRTVGIWEKMSDKFMNALGKEFNFTPPPKHGFDVVAGLQAMHEGRVKVFMGLGGNLLSAGPDTEYAAEAFRRNKLTVQVSTKLNRNHLIVGEQALILPCLGRTEKDVQAEGEQFVSCENSMGVVQSSRGVLKPASPHLMSEVAIIGNLAAVTLKGRTTVDWFGLIANYDRIRDRIERVVPGFDDYNRRVRKHGGFYLPNPPRDKREFNTDAGKAKFMVHPIPKIDLAPGRLLLMTVRSHDQFNTTIYGENDRYRGVFNGRRVVFLNPDDIKALGFEKGQWVNLTSHFEGVQRRADRFMVVPYELPRGCAAAYYPEANPLVPLQHVSDGSNQPASKSIVITLAPSAVSDGVRVSPSPSGGFSPKTENHTQA
jgi:molybdopterin-dependent oxidoreductase alpha subunit